MVILVFNQGLLYSITIRRKNENSGILTVNNAAYRIELKNIKNGRSL